MKIVSNNLFGQTLKDQDLPPSSSKLRIISEGNHIAKHHVVIQIKDSEYFTLAPDETYKQKKKKHFMERHLVLNIGVSYYGI